MSLFFKRAALISGLILVLLIPLLNSQAAEKPELASLVSNKEYLVVELSTEDESQTEKLYEVIERIKALIMKEIDEEELPDLENILKLIKSPNQFLVTLDVTINSSTAVVNSPEQKSISSSISAQPAAEATTNILLYNNANQLAILVRALEKEGHAVTDEVYNGQAYKKVVLESAEEAPEAFAAAGNTAYLADIKGILFITNSLDSLQASIDLVPENSLANFALYKDAKSTILQKLDGVYLASLYVNMDVIFQKITERATGTLSVLANEKIQESNLTDSLSVALKVVPDGVRIESYLNGNKEMMDQVGYFFNLVDFTPNLFKQFPKANPFYYGEIANIKGLIEMMINLMQQQEEKIEKRVSEFDIETGQPIESEPVNYREQVAKSLQESTGLSLDDDILSWLDREFGASMQDSGNLIPALTSMINAASDPDGAQKVIDYLTGALTGLLESQPKQYVTLTTKIFEGKTFYVITVDLPAILADEGGQQFEQYKAVIQELIKPFTITYGLTANNIFLVSTYPDILDHVGESLENNQAFNELYQKIAIGNGGLGYISVENILSYVQRLINLAIDLAPESTDLENAYLLYNITDYLAMIKDMMASRTNQTYTAQESYYIRKGDKPQLTFENFQKLLEEFSSQDSDKDGRNDYQEIYLQKTNPKVADTLYKSSFNDMKNNEWYADVVHTLANQKVVGGYYDESTGATSFRPGQPITRAEFIKMVVTASGIDPIYWDKIPFSDAEYGEWYYPYLTAAYKKGLISGYADGTIRPHTAITRAEALKIVLTANLKNIEGTGTNPFIDVKNHWAESYVIFAFENKLITGINARQFEPDRSLNRAEAAKLIIQTQTFKLNQLQQNSAEETYSEAVADTVAKTLFTK